MKTNGEEFLIRSAYRMMLYTYDSSGNINYEMDIIIIDIKHLIQEDLKWRHKQIVKNKLDLSSCMYENMQIILYLRNCNYLTHLSLSDVGQRLPSESVISKEDYEKCSTYAEIQFIIYLYEKELANYMPLEYECWGSYIQNFDI